MVCVSLVLLTLDLKQLSPPHSPPLPLHTTTQPPNRQGSTRILLTHQRQFLPRCDRVLVLRAGRIQALGTWKEVAELNLPELTAGALLGHGRRWWGCTQACGTGYVQ